MASSGISKTMSAVIADSSFPGLLSFFNAASWAWPYSTCMHCKYSARVLSNRSLWLASCSVLCTNGGHALPPARIFGLISDVTQVAERPVAGDPFAVHPPVERATGYGTTTRGGRLSCRMRRAKPRSSNEAIVSQSRQLAWWSASAKSRPDRTPDTACSTWKP